MISYPILAPDGDLTNPSYSFTGNTGGGMYNGEFFLGIQNNITSLLFSKTTSGNGYILIPATTQLRASIVPSFPPYSFSTATGTGMACSPVDQLNFYTAGSNRMSVGTTGDLNVGSSYLTVSGTTGSIGLGKGWAISGDETWTTRTTPNRAWGGVAWSPTLNLFVAFNMGSGATSGIMTSPDGITWTASSLGAATGDNYYSCVWCDSLGLFVAVAAGTGGLNTNNYSSSDGTTWAINVAPTSDVYKLVWAPELARLVAFPNQNAANIIRYSDNGTSWTAGTSATMSGGWPGGCWSSELRLFVAVSNTASTQAVSTSSDGITWTQVGALTTPTTTWIDVAWSGKLRLFAAVSLTAGTSSVMTSPNGTTWTAQTTPASIGWSRIEWINGVNLFIAMSATVGTNSIMYSANGTTWTQYTIPSKGTFRGLAYSPILQRLVATCATASTTSVLTYQVHSLSESVSDSMVIDGSVHVDQAVTVGGSICVGRTDTERANSKAVLDMRSYNQGFLAPRLTTTEKSAISSPPTGLMAYDRTTCRLCHYDGYTWIPSDGQLALSWYWTASNNTFSRASATPAEVDTAYRISFTVPASGKVLFKLQGGYMSLASTSGVGNIFLTDGSGTSLNAFVIGYKVSTTAFQSQISASTIIQGLTPGAAASYRLYFSGDGSNNFNIVVGSTANYSIMSLGAYAIV